MNKLFSAVCIAGVLLFCVSRLIAEDVSSAPQLDPLEDHPPLESEFGHRFAGHPGPPPSGGGPEQLHPDHRHQPIEAWFEMLRQENPEEFHRLKELLEKDPEAFRQELHRRLQQKQRGAHAPPWGGGSNAYGKEQDKQRVHSRMRKNPKIKNAERKDAELAKKYLKAKDSQKKERLKKELRASLEKTFDLRTEARRNMLKPLEKKLEKLTAKLNEREAHREAIIERRMQELTQGDALSW